MLKNFGNLIGPRLVDEEEPLLLWRSWLLKRPFGMLHLRSTYQKGLWGPGTQTARCNVDRDRCNVSLGPYCVCGFWGTKTLFNLACHNAVGHYPVAALGRIRAWGFVIEYEHGFRVSKCVIDSLWLGDRSAAVAAQALSLRYGVPVDTGLPLDAAQAEGIVVVPQYASKNA